VAALRRRAVEDFITARATAHPRSAKNELELLKRVLGDAKARGQKVDPAVLVIPPIRHHARRGRALTVRELSELAAWFTEHSSRLVLVAGQVGARQNLWFNLTDDMLDLKVSTLTARRAREESARASRLPDRGRDAAPARAAARSGRWNRSRVPDADGPQVGEERFP